MITPIRAPLPPPVAGLAPLLDPVFTVSLGVSLGVLAFFAVVEQPTIAKVVKAVIIPTTPLLRNPCIVFLLFSAVAGFVHAAALDESGVSPSSLY